MLPDRLFSDEKQQFFKKLQINNLRELEDLIAHYEDQLYPVSDANTPEENMKRYANIAILAKKVEVESFLESIRENAVNALFSSNSVIRTIAEDLHRRESDNAEK